jgi:hypothetical protein
MCMVALSVVWTTVWYVYALTLAFFVTSASFEVGPPSHHRILTFLSVQPLGIPSTPVEDIVQAAIERAELLLDYSPAVRALKEPEFFDYLDDILLANDDDAALAEALDNIAVEYRWVSKRFCVPFSVGLSFLIHILCFCYPTVSTCQNDHRKMHAQMRCCIGILPVVPCIPMVASHCRNACRPCVNMSGMYSQCSGLLLCVALAVKH